MKESLELRKVRDFGELINDTFVFTLQNWKSLLRITAIICGAFLFVSATAAVFQQQKVMGIFTSGGTVRSPWDMYGLEAFFSTLFAMLSYLSISLTTLCYISLYREKGNEQPSVEEVWSFFKYYFWRFLGSQFLLTILFFLGFVMCFAPGIYLLPIISIILSVIVFENGTLSYSFERGFKLIKGNWWPVFGAMTIVVIVVYAMMMVLILPASFVTGASVFLGNFKGSTSLLVAMTVLQHLCQVFMVLVQVVIALSYFSLVESKEATSLIDRLDDLGKNDSPNGLPEEQY